MRAGGCTVQQTLTAEAASVVKHAVGLAQKRGHAQVTPLHVAAALLAPGASLLRQACLKSHPHSTSHPLQCRALELCFNVALNRLPTAAAAQPVHGQPSLSNALVAALKRAQAHQRRGCLEQQQQPPLLAVKVEMEQLIISILDDPSVSRVMREAGFSSIFVKNKIEETVSSFVFPSSSFDNNQEFSVSPSGSGPNGPVTENADIGSGNSFVNNSGRINSLENPAMGCEGLSNEDAESVLEVLLGNKTRRNTVIVGDCLATTENVAREVINRIKRGDVPDPMRAARLISLPFSCTALRLLTREEVEQKLKELRMEVNDWVGRGPVVIYGGDLKWAVDVREQNDNNEHYDDNIGRDGVNAYCVLQHISMELGRILGGHGENRRLWLIATANYQTYMRCRMGHPSLETFWGLQAVPVPSGGLTLTLQASSTGQVKSKTSGIGSNVLVPVKQNLLWPTPPLKTADSNNDGVDTLSCCFECRAYYEAEAEFEREQVQRSSSNDRDLSFWPQQSRNVEFSTHLAAQVEAKRSDLRKKWNQTCRSRHSHSFDPMRHQRPSFESPQHTSDLVSRMNPPLRSAPQTYPWSEMSSPLPSTILPPAWSDHQWSTPENARDSSMKRSVPAREPGGFDVKTTLALGFTQTDSKRSNEDTHHYSGSHHFAAGSSIRSAVAANHLRQFDTGSVKEFCERLTEKVPWQGEENVQAIVSSILQCRTGMVRRESTKKVKEDVWLLVLGPDRRGKMKMAQALAETVFGSQEKLVCFTSPWSRGRVHDDNADFSSRGKTYLDRLTQRIACDPHCVVVVEEIDEADAVFMAAILGAMERGKLMDSNGREVSLSDVILFMTSSVGAKYFPKFRSVKGVQFDEEKLSQVIAGPSCSFKLALQEGEQQEIEAIWGKRKAEWDPMKDERTEKRRSPLLDLNAEADEGAINLTLQTDTLSDPILCSARHCFSQRFMESIDKCIVFRPLNFAELAESLLEILHNSYGRASNGRGSLEVETSVLERMVSCCWELAPSGRETFEKWVEDVFEPELARLLLFSNLKAKSVVKLSMASENNNRDFTYLNSCLPATLEIGGCNNYESMGSLFLLSKLHRYNSSSKSLVQVHG